MEEDKGKKHMCKFCSKIFPCGRSLGGHMRSHLITIPSSSDHLHKKKLPPLVNEKVKNHSNNTNKSLKPSDEDTLLQDKLCKECGKSFQSWKALFGHMKWHSVNAKIGSSTPEENSSNSSNDHHKLMMIMDSQSDNEAANPLCKRKRSDRMKRYTATTTNSSSLTNANPSSSSMIIDDELEQEEVALSLIILSRDKGDWDIGLNSVLDSSDHDHSSHPVEAKKIESFKFKKQLELKNLPDNIPRNGVVKTRKLQVSADDKFDEECEVNSPKNLIKRSDLCGNFEISKKSKSRKRKSIESRASELSLSSAYYAPSDSELCHDFERKSKFSCSICKKAFSSYQALGGHRASHKKFKGCCAPISENILENNNSVSTNQSGVNVMNTNLISVSEAQVGWKKSIKEHECPICFKVFSSGQALGGHKRSHLISDLSKNEMNRKPIKKTRDFLDLNLPAPDEEECNDDFKAWWIGTSHEHEPEPLLGLLSS